MRLYLRLLPCAASLLLTATLVQADTITLLTGAPSNAYNLPPITKPSPYYGGPIVSFDGLTPCATFPPAGCTNESGYSSQGLTFTSADGLYVIPYSTQTGPNELFDNGAGGTADLFIETASGHTLIGVGIADSDTNATGAPVTITLQPLSAGNVDLGSAINVMLPTGGSNPGNGYFVVEDASGANIYGLQITQSYNSVNNSGLAIDDVQSTPEPSTLLLLGAGLGVLGFRFRKRASGSTISFTS